MLRKTSSRKKLLVPIFSLISILTLLGAMLIVFNYKNIVALSELNEKILFSNMLSDTLHSIQKERGLSSGFVVNENNKFKKELLSQRKNTDKYVKKLYTALENISCEHFKNTVSKLLVPLKDLESIRKNIDESRYDYNTLVEKYSSINSSLLDIIVNIAKTSHIPALSQNIIAYVNLLYLKEYMGKERAQGVVMISQRKPNMPSLARFTNLMALQKQCEDMFVKYAHSDIKKKYKYVINSAEYKEVKNLEKKILNKELLKLNFDPQEWFNLISRKLDAYNRIGKYIKENSTEMVQKELSDAKILFIFVVSLTFISLIIFTFMLMALLRLLKDEQRLRIVMDRYIISSVTDLKGIITDVSEAFCKISGYTKSELIGKNHNIVRHPDMPKVAFEELWKKIKRGESWRGKVKNKKKDGGFYWVFANIEPLYDSNGNIDAYISVRLDITENELLMLKIKDEEQRNKKQEEMMQQQHRLAQMGEMISMIAHQWRQPLSAITAATASINLKATLNKLDNKTAIELAEKIKEFSIHLSSTIDDFRNFFQTKKTKTITNYKIMTDSVISILDSSLEKNSIELEIEIDDLIELNVYENELKQVMLNIIKNAEDALLEKEIRKPKIKINIDGYKMIICDNAGGIEEKIIDKIFEPYFSTKLKKDGTGLGLYMSKIIIEDHSKGSLSVRNSDEGACFTIDLGGQNG
jgi:PAS domain S-box-containing protein